MSPTAGEFFAAANAAFAQALDLFGIGRAADRPAVLALLATTLNQVGSIRECGPGHGANFRNVWLAETTELVRRLAAPAQVTRADLGTAVMAVELALRVAELRYREADSADACLSCGSPHLKREDDLSAGAAIFRCLDCGLSADYCVPA